MEAPRASAHVRQLSPAACRARLLPTGALVAGSAGKLVTLTSRQKLFPALADRLLALETAACAAHCRRETEGAFCKGLVIVGTIAAAQLHHTAQQNVMFASPGASQPLSQRQRRQQGHHPGRPHIAHVRNGQYR
jgi:hypothetical protein